jgi:hypothetical protein
MKKVCLIVSCLILTLLVVGQSHLVVYTKDGNHLETLVSNVDSIAFSKTSVAPDVPVKPTEPNPIIASGLRNLVDEAYKDLNWLHDHWGYWGLNTATTDEARVPLRNPGRMWNDGGIWEDLNTMEWDAMHVSFGLVWRSSMQGVLLCNQLLKQISVYKDEVDAKQYEGFVAELNVLRSYYYYTLFDLFGRIPYTEELPEDENAHYPLLDVQQVWEKLVTCLEVHTPNLPVANVPSKVDNYGRVTQGLGYALLARLYLNAESFDVKTANPYNNCVEYCQKVISSGAYSIEPNFFNNFLVHNENSQENIFVIVENGNESYKYQELGAYLLNKLRINMITQHYAFQESWGLLEKPWNGFAASEAFLELYDRKDRRGPCPDGAGMNIDFQNVNTKYGWFLGPVFDKEGKQAVDRNGLEVVITRAFEGGLKNATWNEGARCMKYETELNSTVNKYAENDFVLFRYADVLYMYAEACLRGATNGSLSDILGNADFQRIRTRAGVEPYTFLDLDELLDERGREFAWENVRRRDLIRFGKYTGNSYMWDFKAENVPTYCKWFPIPEKEIEAHAKDKQFWTQNEGYDANTEFTLDKLALLMTEKEAAQEVCALYAPDEVQWFSSDTKGEVFAMTIERNKIKVTPIAPGEGTIVALCKGKTVTCTVTVKEAVFKLDTEIVRLTAEDEPYEVHALNAKADVTWSSSDTNETIFKITPQGNKAIITPVAPGEGTITATCAGKSVVCTVVITIPLPAVAGTEGKYTIAFKIPEALACDPVINLFGAFQGYDPSDLNAPVAEKIEAEGFENWYKIVFESEDSWSARGKLCPQMGGKGDWGAQGTYTLIKGDAEIEDDYGTQNSIACAESALGGVVYVNVTEWAVNPCFRPNEAGPATYEVIIKTDFPADLDPYNDIVVTVTVGWNIYEMEMEYDPSYAGQGLRFTGSVDECPANEQYKYVISYKGSEWILEKGYYRVMNYERNVKDEVTDWDKEPWIPVPGGEGTFKVTLCAAPAGDVYIAGNFTEEGEGGYWEDCVGNKDYKMTLKEGTTYTWTGVYPEAFMFRVVDYVNADHVVWYGGSGGNNFELDGENFTFEAACK